MAGNPVNWFEIYVQDMERAKAFYQGVLGVELQPVESSMMEMWAFPMVEGGAGAGGALAKMEHVPSGGNSTLIYFNCDDCAVEAGRIEEFGGKLAVKKMSIGEHGFIAVGVDTEGNSFGLASEV